MSFNELVFIVPISVVYAIFVDQFAPIIVSCLFLVIALLTYPFTSPKMYTEEEKDAMLTLAENTRMILALVFSFAGILFGLNQQNIAGKGVAAGGVLAIIYQIFSNRTTLKYSTKVTILGVLLLSLITSSYLRS